MSNNATPERGILPAHAYPPEQRELHATQHILFMAALGCAALDRLQSWRVAQTYRVPVDFVRAMKRQHMSELSFGEGK